jgi:3-oxoacyl-[acyl-carrier-protein] synthase II
MKTFRDLYGRPLVAVTGVGVVTSLGWGIEENWRKLIGGESGIRSISRFSTHGLRTTIAGTIDSDLSDTYSAPILSQNLAEYALHEALAMSGLGRLPRSGHSGDFPGALFLAMPPVELEWSQRCALAQAHIGQGSVTYRDLLEAVVSEKHNALLEPWRDLFLFGTLGARLASHFGTCGMPIALSTACASGATAICAAVDALRRGEMDAALVCGTDGSIHVETLVRFSLLSALSTQNAVPSAAAKPFSKNRDGFVMGEGAGALVLETYESLVARGGKACGFILGCGEKGDNFHRTRSSPDGKPIITAISKALYDSGRDPDSIDGINAHGTGTLENDKMEALACETVFGEHIRNIPISSNKSMIGHTLTAAGAIEAVFSLWTMRHGRIPPTINYTCPDPSFSLDVVPNTARDGVFRRMLSNSFGFGGQNTCLVLGSEASL